MSALELCLSWFLKCLLKQNKSTEGCSKLKMSVEMTSAGMASTLAQIQVPYGIGPGDRRSKRSLMASRTRCKCPIETSRNKVITSKTVIRSSSVTRSRFSELSDQWHYKRSTVSAHRNPHYLLVYHSIKLHIYIFYEESKKLQITQCKSNM